MCSASARLTWTCKHVEQRSERLVAASLLPRHRCAPIQEGHDCNDLHMRRNFGSDMAGMVSRAARSTLDDPESCRVCRADERA